MLPPFRIVHRGFRFEFFLCFFILFLFTARSIVAYRFMFVDIRSFASAVVFGFSSDLSP